MAKGKKDLINDNETLEEAINAKNAKKEIDRIKEDMDKKRELCQTMEFPTTVLAVKYTDKGTQFEAYMPDTVIADINKQKRNLRMYKISLVPKFN